MDRLACWVWCANYYTPLMRDRSFSDLFSWILVMRRDNEEGGVDEEQSTDVLSEDCQVGCRSVVMQLGCTASELGRSWPIMAARC